MSKSLKIAKRGAALALAGAMACSCALGAAAQSGSVKKEETVYATLSSDGTVQKATDSVWLHDAAGLSGYATDTGLSGVTMLKDTENPQEDGSKLTFAEGTDAYYQGAADAALPVTAAITYTLDGTEMTAEELAGKSGHLVMHVALTNNSCQTETIDGVSRRVCTPFVTVVAMTLDTDTFTGVTAEHGTVETDASQDLVAYVCLPGMKECFDGLLKGDLSQLGDKLYDDVTLEADVTDFEMPMLYIAAATDAQDFSQESELSDFNDLFDELDGLDDKVNEMMDGVDELLKGSNELNSGAGDLYNGIQTMDAGAATLQTGAHQASDGAASAASGAGTLSSGLNTLSGNSQSLRDGSYQVFQQICASAQSQINTGLEANGLGDHDVTLTPETYSGQLDTLLGVLGGAAYQQALATVTSQVNANADAICAGYIASDATLAQQACLGAAQQTLMTYLMSVEGGGKTQEQAAAYLATADGQAQIAAAAAGMTNEQKQAAYTGAAALLSAEQETAILQGYIDQQMQSDAIQSQINAGLAGNASYQGVLGAKTSLNSYNAFYVGLKTYTAGVDSAASGAATLSSGLNTLKDGSAQLASGADSLKTGADQLLTGASTLKTGTGTLVDGVQELYDGVNEAYNKLENGGADISTADLQNIKDTLDAVKAQRESYKSFAGDAADEGSVKFVMKVSAQKTDDAETAAAAPADTVQNGNFFTNLWQRIVALFHN